MNRDSIPGSVKYFFILYLKTSRQASEPVRNHIQWIKGTFSSTIRWLELEAYHSLSQSADVMHS